MPHLRRTRPALRLLGVGLLTLLALAFTGLLAQQPRPGALHNPTDLARAEALVKDVFKEEFAKAKTDRAAGKKLAGTLLEQAKQIHEEAAVRFVALREARDLAARAGDTVTAFLAVAELARDRPTDVLAMKASVLAEAAKNLAVNDHADSRTEATALAETTFAVAGSAADADDFDRAVGLAELAEGVARKAKALALVATVNKRLGQLRVLQKETAHVRPFAERLKAKADDADANLEVGKYWAFFRGSWLKGLPLLARGSDAGLRDLAGRDLAQPRDGNEQRALADGWWQRGQADKGTGRLPLLARSYQWYQQALHQLEGPARQQVEDRLGTLRRLLPPELRVTDIAVSLRKLEGHTGEVLGAALSPSGRQALSGSTDRTVRLWDTATGQELKRFEGHAGPVYGVAFAPDGKLAASCGEDRLVLLWDSATGKERKRLAGHTDVVNNLAFMPDGRHLASASDDRTVRLWEVETGKEVRRFEGHTQGVFGLAFSPDGSLLATSGTDQTIRLWGAGSGKEQRRLLGHTGQVLTVAFSPDGRRLLSSSEDQTVRLWEVETGKELRRYRGHTATVGGVAFAPDGLRFLSCSDDRTVRLWEVETAKELRKLEGHAEAIYRVVFSADGRLALTCSLDKTLRVWSGPR
jgi:predicted NACHT family NTPase